MKKPLIFVGGALGIALLTWGLILIARGDSYVLTVTSPSIGPDDAPVVIEEFSDFECSACGAAAPLIKEALQDYPTQVKFVYKNFPLSSIHPQARSSAAGALCAAQQDKFKEFHDGLFETQREWAAARNVDEVMDGLVDNLGINKAEWESCIGSRDAKKAIDADFSEGRDRGVNSTPTFFVNGTQIQNPQSVFQWIKAIDKALEDKGITPENSISDLENSEEEVTE